MPLAKTVMGANCFLCVNLLGRRLLWASTAMGADCFLCVNCYGRQLPWASTTMGVNCHGRRKTQPYRIENVTAGCLFTLNAVKWSFTRNVECEAENSRIDLTSGGLAESRMVVLLLLLQKFGVLMIDTKVVGYT